jgi:hypothetical protein
MKVLQMRILVLICHVIAYYLDVQQLNNLYGNLNAVLAIPGSQVKFLLEDISVANVDIGFYDRKISRLKVFCASMIQVRDFKGLL